jgi:hypothetical protein
MAVFPAKPRPVGEFPILLDFEEFFVFGVGFRTK